MISVEGPDGAGKTTLVGKLCEEFDLNVGTRATTDRDKLYTVTRQDTYTALAQAVRGDERPRIWDRLFFSEMVYAPVVKRPCEFSRVEQGIVRRILIAIGVPIIVCAPDLDTVRENVKKEKQMSGVVEAIDTIYRDYQTLFHGMPNVSYYDYTDEKVSWPGYRTYDETKQLVNHYLNQRKVREWTSIS